jgi:protein-disulfide isomerase
MDWLTRARVKRLVAGSVTIVAVGFLAVFAWRVTHYTRLIKSGNLSFEDLAFLGSYTPSALASAFPEAQGTFHLATADDPSLGSPTASVTIVEFADFGCPYSRTASFTMRSLAQKYGDRIRYVYRDFPVVELHEDAPLAAEAGQCAAEQGKFWEYHDKLYANQDDLREEKLFQYAREANLDEEKFTSCFLSHRYAAEVAEDYLEGLEAGVRGTPTFFVNGTRIPGAIPEVVLDRIIKGIIGG